MHTFVLRGLLSNGWALCPAWFPKVRDKDLYTTTNKCLQCLINIMCTVF